MRVKHLKVVLFLLLLIFISCSNEKDELMFPLAEMANVDAKKLEKAYKNASEIKGLGALILERDDIIISEKYFNQYTKNTLFNIRSITKSISSILMGITLDKQIIDSINQRVADYIFNQYLINNQFKNEITFYDALTMSAGLYWNEWDYTNGFYNNYILAPNQIDFLFAQELKDTPGTVFTYNSALPHLLSVIITDYSGLNTLEFAKKNLFEPLEIDTLDWANFNNGYYNGGGDLFLRPIDLVKIGRLMLNKGVYKNKVIISNDWVNQSTREYISTNNASPHGTGYAFWWWIGNAHSVDFFWGNGYGGQFLICIPSKNTIIVATSNHVDSGNSATTLWSKVESLIINEIIPCIN